MLLRITNLGKPVELEDVLEGEVDVYRKPINDCWKTG